MASLDILCSSPPTLNKKNYQNRTENILRPIKILRNITWHINIYLKYFMIPTKTLHPPSYILNVRSLRSLWLRRNFSLDKSNKVLVSNVFYVANFDLCDPWHAKCFSLFMVTIIHTSWKVLKRETWKQDGTFTEDLIIQGFKIKESS